MSATYNELLLTDLDRARSLLGDTIVSPASKALHSDEHMAAVLEAEGSLAAGVAYLADELVTRFAQQPVRIADDGSSIDFSARIPVWQALATRMRALALATAQSGASTPASTQAVSTTATW
ncbi:MAG TPA: hypothetical protein VFU22_02590 [Roseiflexaceae bacterium]|nr:hypothetical protein [Roseiflexaceae bacterium]